MEEEAALLSVKKKGRQIPAHAEIRDKKLHGLAHKMHRKEQFIPEKTMGPDCE